jgi:hypothetical protein
MWHPSMAISFGVGEARVAELADAPDLGSGGQPWGFESPLSHTTAIPANDKAFEPVDAPHIGRNRDGTRDAHGGSG